MEDEEVFKIPRAVPTAGEAYCKYCEIETLTVGFPLICEICLTAGMPPLYQAAIPEPDERYDLVFASCAGWIMYHSRRGYKLVRYDHHQDPKGLHHFVALLEADIDSPQWKAFCKAFDIDLEESL